jgi:tryptophan 2,3-dioxygenase
MLKDATAEFISAAWLSVLFCCGESEFRTFGHRALTASTLQQYKSLAMMTTREYVAESESWTPSGGLVGTQLREFNYIANVLL